MAVKKWQEILSELTSAHEKNIQQIDRNDIVGFCMENKMIRNRIDDYLKSIKPTGKDSAVASQKKEQGNQNFVKKKFEECLQLYTESIFYAKENDEILPFAYANRALILQHLNYLTESIADIELALASGYPRHKAEKLKLRKAKCLKLKNKEDVCQHNKNQKALFQSGSSNDIKVKSLLQKEYQLPKFAGGENQNFASASSYLSLYFNKTKGRHVIAKKNIQVGEILFVEKAFAFVTCQQTCAYCLETTIAPIPCKHCLDVIYCSSKCREDSWRSDHSFLCGFGELFKSVGIAHLSVKIIIAASNTLEDLKNKLSKISEPLYKIGPISFKSKEYDSVYNLVHHFEEFQIDDLFQYAMTALLLAVYMKNHTRYFPAEAGDEDLNLLTSVILRHILQMICNGQAVMAAFLRGSKDSMVLSKAEKRIATAIFPSVSMMNHSCVPSVMIGFYKTYIIVQAAKELKQGEEVFNCYGTDARRMERAQRHEILSKQYFFNCECEVCLQEFDIKDKFTAFKCSFCQGPFVQKNKTLPEAVCVDCGQKSQISTQLLSKVNNFYSLLEEGKLLSGTNTSLKKCLEAWRLGREIFYKFHEDLSLVTDLIALNLATQQDFKRCLSFLRCQILSVEHRFGEFSLEFIQEMNKLFDVQLAYIGSSVEKRTDDMDSELKFMEKTVRILNILNGNPYFHEINPTLEELLQAFANL